MDSVAAYTHQTNTSTPRMETESPSAQAKQIAELFIKILSSQTAPTFNPVKFNPPDAQLKETLSTWIEKGMEGDLTKSKNFYIVNKGKHHTVWGHPDYSHLVFKVMNREEAETQLKSEAQCLSLVQEEKGSWVQIPRASAIHFDKISVYVEERLPLSLDSFQHQEFWARILTHYESSTCPSLFKANLQQMVDTIQRLVEEAGFWDVGPKNLPEVRTDGMGVCGTDFENMDGKPVNVADGLGRLAHLFPLAPLVDNVVKGYKKKVPDLLESEMQRFNAWKKYVPDAPPPTKEKIFQKFNLILEGVNEELKVLQSAIKTYDERGYVTGDEEIVGADFSSLDEQERSVAQAIWTRIQKQLEEKRDKKSPISEKRCLHWQPQNIDHFSRERFVKVLKLLKEQNIIIGWSDDYKYREFTEIVHSLDAYDIRF